MVTIFASDNIIRVAAMRMSCQSRIRLISRMEFLTVWQGRNSAAFDECLKHSESRQQPLLKVATLARGEFAVLQLRPATFRFRDPLPEISGTSVAANVGGFFRRKLKGVFRCPRAVHAPPFHPAQTGKGTTADLLNPIRSLTGCVQSNRDVSKSNASAHQQRDTVTGRLPTAAEEDGQRHPENVRLFIPIISTLENKFKKSKPRPVGSPCPLLSH